MNRYAIPSVVTNRNPSSDCRMYVVCELMNNFMSSYVDPMRRMFVAFVVMPAYVCRHNIVRLGRPWVDRGEKLDRRSKICINLGIRNDEPKK